MKKILIAAILVFTQMSLAKNFEQGECLSYKGYKACIKDDRGYFIRESDQKVLISYGFPPSTNYGGQSPGLTCQKTYLAVTRFNEELFIFDCEGTPYGANLCEKPRRPFYLQEQNANINPLKVERSTEFKAYYEITNDGRAITIIQGGAPYHYNFNKAVKEAFWTKPILNNLQQATAHIGIEFMDGSTEYYSGYERYYYIHNGILSTDTDELCQSK